MNANIFETLDLAASSDLTSYNPQRTIGAVNALIPLGKDGALAALSNYYREADLDADPRHGLFWILRVLFEIPADPGYHPPVHLGVPSPPEPQDLKKLPRFPIVLIDDIPILTVTSYLLGGLPETVESHLEHFQLSGVIRTTLLRPTIDIGDHNSVARFLATYRTRYEDAYETKPLKSQVEFIHSQLRRMKQYRSGH